MNDLAKIHLSQEEKELVKNTEWIFSKRLILKKAEKFLLQMQYEYQLMLLNEYKQLTHTLLPQRSKIAKGENYKGLPWLMLDYPAIFEKDGILAVRTMFWWGNYFSTTLHISGRYLSAPQNIRHWINFLSLKDLYINVNESEWEHDFSAENFIKAKSLTEHQMQTISKKTFFKAGTTVPLNDWEEAAPALQNSVKTYLKFIEVNFLPTDETNL